MSVFLSDVAPWRAATAFRPLFLLFHHCHWPDSHRRFRRFSYRRSDQIPFPFTGRLSPYRFSSPPFCFFFPLSPACLIVCPNLVSSLRDFFSVDNSLALVLPSAPHPPALLIFFFLRFVSHPLFLFPSPLFSLLLFLSSPSSPPLSAAHLDFFFLELPSFTL